MIADKHRFIDRCVFQIFCYTTLADSWRKKIGNREKKPNQLPSVIDEPSVRSNFPILIWLYKTLPYAETWEKNLSYRLFTGGSASTVRIRLFFSFKYMLTPANVPPVPALQITASTLPSKWQCFDKYLTKNSNSNLSAAKFQVLLIRNVPFDSLDYRTDSSRDSSCFLRHIVSPRIKRKRARKQSFICLMTYEMIEIIRISKWHNRHSCYLCAECF